MDVESLIPSFPEISESIARELYFKQEFYENRLPSSIPHVKGQLFPQQKVVARFLDKRSPYNGLLVVHETGTGKTCAAFAAAEANKEDKRIVFLATGRPLIRKFQRELGETCFPERYRDKILKSDGTRRKQLRLKKYTFSTHGVYTTRLSKNKLKSSSFEDTLFIIDEIHRIRKKVKDTKNNVSPYEQIFKLFHSRMVNKSDCTIATLPLNSKVVLLSATPMFDQADEIIDVLNLLLPAILDTKDTKKLIPALELEGNFENGKLTYRKVEKSGICSISEKTSEGEGNQALLKEAMYGLVSYMKRPKGVNYKFMEPAGGSRLSIENQEKLKPLKLWPCYMKGEQLAVYQGAFQKFEGIGKGKGKYQGLERAGCGSFNHSTKYDAFIENVRNAQKNGKKVFAYIRTVSAKLMELKDGKLVEPAFNCKEKKAKAKDSCYGGLNVLKERLRKAKLGKVLYYQGDSTDAERDKSIAKFNNPNNARGEKFPLLVGTQAIREGVTLKDVQEVHVLQPSWNYSSLDQVLGRALRAESHVALIDRERKEEASSENFDFPAFEGVDVYLYAAMPPAEDEDEEGEEKKKDGFDGGSLDLFMYLRSVEKDKSIARVRRTLKEAAIDCPLFYKRNVATEYGSRDCEYGDCEYNCAGFEDRVEFEELINKNLPFCGERKEEKCITSANFNSWYDSYMTDQCIIVISDFMRGKEISGDGSYYVGSLVQDVISSFTGMGISVSKTTVFKTIDKMVTEKIRVLNANGLSMALSISGDKVFLSGSLEKDSGSSRTLVLNEKQDPEYVDNVGLSLFGELLNQSCSNLLQMLDFVPPVMKLFILKESIDAAQTGNPNIVQKVLETDMIQMINGMYTITFSYSAEDSESTKTVKAYKTNEGRWCGNEEAVKLDSTINGECYNSEIMTVSLIDKFANLFQKGGKYFLMKVEGGEKRLITFDNLYNESGKLTLKNLLAKAHASKDPNTFLSLPYGELVKKISKSKITAGQNMTSKQIKALRKVLTTLVSGIPISKDLKKIDLVNMIDKKMSENNENFIVLKEHKLPTEIKSDILAAAVKVLNEQKRIK